MTEWKCIFHMGYINRGKFHQICYTMHLRLLIRSRKIDGKNFGMFQLEILRGPICDGIRIIFEMLMIDFDNDYEKSYFARNKREQSFPAFVKR